MTNNNSSRCLSALLWNARGLRNTIDDLTHAITTSNIDVAVITETHSIDSKYTPPITGYNTFDVCHTSRSSGVAIYLHSRLHAKLRPDLSLSETVGESMAIILTIEISPAPNERTGMHYKPLFLTGCYIPPSTPTRQQNALYSCLEKIIAIPTHNNIIAGDFNCWSSLFGDGDDGQTNQFISRLVDQHGLTVANALFCPGIPTHNRGHVLDLFITNNPLIISGMTVLPHLIKTEKDHYPCVLTLHVETTTTAALNTHRLSLPPIGSPEYEGYRTVTDDMLTHYLSDIKLNNPTNQEIADTKTTAITKAIMDAANYHFATHVRPPPPKYSPYTRMVCRDKRDIYNKWIRAKHKNSPKTAELHALFKQLDHKAKLNKAQDKRERWLKRVNSICAAHTTNPLKRVIDWHRFNDTKPKNRTKPINITAKPNDPPPTTTQQSLNNLATSYSKVFDTPIDRSDSKQYSHIHNTLRSASQLPPPPIRPNQPVMMPAGSGRLGMDELESALKLISRNTAPG
jgi:hypothetical protein